VYTECARCPVGKYSNKYNSVTCSTCEFGRYQDQLGKVDCIDCPSGKYQDQRVQSACKLCHAGRYIASRRQDQMCRQCPEGKYQSTEGHEACNSCSPGKFGASGGLGGIGEDVTQTYSAYHGEEGTAIHATNRLVNVTALQKLFRQGAPPGGTQGAPPGGFRGIQGDPPGAPWHQGAPGGSP